MPADWERSVGGEGWAGPEGDGSYAALSVGTDASWTDPAREAEGVFLGLMPGGDLPELVPTHPECDEQQSPVVEEGEVPSVTVLSTGCGGGTGVVVERVLQVAGNRLLWVQVRSLDRPTANRVLDSVTTSGI
ncbi:hypothetical protein [Nocardioides marinisabuli]|uniref:hypothetical protein n=1 Tax=Nocardioides marinisabuli TaxID=419476 RepID=UPI002155E2CC|nr:hypothetical protein [Nocardioides marinisabuli]